MWNPDSGGICTKKYVNGIFLFHANDLITDKKTIGNICGDHFSTVIKKNLKKTFYQTHFFVPSVDIINNLKNRKSTGHVNISVRILKQSGYFISHHLTTIVQWPYLAFFLKCSKKQLMTG